MSSVEKLILTAITDNGVTLDESYCKRLMLIPAEMKSFVAIDDKIKNLQQPQETQIQEYLEIIRNSNEGFFIEEQDKLDRWAEDSKETINQELKALEKEIKDAKKTARAMKTLDEKTVAQRHVKKLEKDHDKKMNEYFETRKQVDEKSSELLDAIEAKLALKHTLEEIFILRWHLV